MALTARQSHRYLGGAAVDPPYANSPGDLLELDESDIWAIDDVSGADEPEKAHNRPARKAVRNPPRDGNHPAEGPRSLPVNVPDWPRILGDAYKPRAAGSSDGACGDWEGAGNYKMPPHEFLARNRVAPFSVTLKGRDLRRVRNAIWKKTGFED
ncbi:Protein of unknown function- DUF584 [Striga hermonthica]|uniref:Senescence regulator n=1 Tax=Striga hermonthica TaxID=68872 RepID=A0A9N7NFU7_STRHE|nr:Protein of unknown function- DUF584 [Striga hermonthica]